jgi:hypothetical protein
MNLRRLGYGVLCVTALFYLMTANARGYVPFSASLARGSGFGTSGGHYFFFHK